MLNVNDNGKALVFSFHSRMDTYKSQEIEKELNAMVTESSKNIIFDLDGVMYISSYFLRICLNTVQTVGFERFSVRNAKADIKKIFVVAGFDQQMNIK